MQLKSYMIPSKGPILSSDPSPCFIIEVYLESKNYKVLTLLDLEALIYFIDKDFVKKEDIVLVEKIKPMHIEVINGRSLSFENITYKIISIEIATSGHNN